MRQRRQRLERRVQQPGIGRRGADLTGSPVDHFQGITEMRLPAQKGVVLGDQAFALGDRRHIRGVKARTVPRLGQLVFQAVDARQGRERRPLQVAAHAFGPIQNMPGVFLDCQR